MIKRCFCSAIVCFLVVVSACEEEAVLEQDFLYSQWTHAFEEQEDANASKMIFRLTNSQSFAPSRFRQSYIFNDDGSCSYWFLDPADAHHFKAGSFEYHSATNSLTIFNDEGDSFGVFRVLELAADKLVMERQ